MIHQVSLFPGFHKKWGEYLSDRLVDLTIFTNLSGCVYLLAIYQAATPEDDDSGLSDSEKLESEIINTRSIKIHSRK